MFCMFKYVKIKRIQKTYFAHLWFRSSSSCSGRSSRRPEQQGTPRSESDRSSSCRCCCGGRCGCCHCCFCCGRFGWRFCGRCCFLAKNVTCEVAGVGRFVEVKTCKWCKMFYVKYIFINYFK